VLPRIAEIKIEMRKGRFSSRSEAGRYAAQQRWKNHQKEEEPKTAGKSLDELFGKYGKATLVGEFDRTFSDGRHKRMRTVDIETPDGKIVRMDFEATANPDGTEQDLQVKLHRRGEKLDLGFLWAMHSPNNQFGIGTDKIGVASVDVRKKDQKKGWASLMWNVAQNYAIGGQRVYHSTMLTTAGAAFARANPVPVDKATFNSRSEAGRYAANIRWQGHDKLDSGKVIGNNGSGKGEPMTPTITVPSDRKEVGQALRKAGFKQSNKVGRGFSSGFSTYKLGGERVGISHTIATGASSSQDNQIVEEMTTKYAKVLQDAGFSVSKRNGVYVVIGKTSPSKTISMLPDHAYVGRLTYKKTATSMTSKGTFRETFSLTERGRFLLDRKGIVSHQRRGSKNWTPLVKIENVVSMEVADTESNDLTGV
jgi:Arc/MetJ-type ribon-helix-helix transcriptional regulator